MALPTWTLTGTLKDHNTRPLAGVQVKVVPTPTVTVDAAGDTLHLGSVLARTDSTGVLVDPVSKAAGVKLVAAPDVTWTVVIAGYGERWIVGPTATTTKDLSDFTSGRPPFLTPTEAASLEARIAALEAGGIGGGGGDVLTSVSGAVTLPATAATGALYGYRVTSRATFSYSGGSVQLDPGAYAFEKTATGWSYRLLAEGTAVPTSGGGGTTPPPADTTAPTGGTLAVSGSGAAGSTRTLTVSGASDSGSGLHATPYAFSLDGGTTWSSWQSSPSWTSPALAAGTYQPRARVRDAATTPNVATLSAASFTVTAAPPPGDVWDDFARFTASSYADLTSKATTPSGHNWVALNPQTSWAANVSTTTPPPCRMGRMDIIANRHAGILLSSNHIDAEIDFTMTASPAASTWWRFGVGDSATNYVAAMMEWTGTAYRWGIWHNTNASPSSSIVTAPALTGRARITYDGTTFKLYLDGTEVLSYSTASAPVTGLYLGLGAKGDSSGNCFWDNLALDYLA